MSRVVITPGGNTLGNTSKEQQEHVGNAAPALIDLTKQRHGTIISYGSGPQVGIPRQASDTASAVNEKVPVSELPECMAMNQGYIGFHLQKGIKKELCREGMPQHVTTVVTQIVVDKDDPTFLNPTKPTDSFCTAEEALKMTREDPKLYMKEDTGGGYRQMVASLKSADIAEQNPILGLLDHESIIITCGGGGIPVILDESGDYESIPAVIDKDLVFAKLVELMDTNYLFILATVDWVTVNYGKPEQRELKEIIVEEAENLCRKGHFAPGSMLPKVGAAMESARSKRGRNAVTPSLEKAPLVTVGESGTRVTL